MRNRFHNIDYQDEIALSEVYGKSTSNISVPKWPDKLRKEADELLRGLMKWSEYSSSLSPAFKCLKESIPYDLIIDFLICPYIDPRRFYHDWNHVTEVIIQIDLKNSDKLSPRDLRNCVLAALFHDVVYDIDQSDEQNVSQSAMLCIELLKDSPILNEEDLKSIEHAILATSYGMKDKSEWEYYAETNMGLAMIEADLHNLKHPKADILKKNFRDIFREFGKHSYPDVRENNPKALEALCERVCNYVNIYDGVYLAKQMAMSYRPLIGIYAGSFNPMHIGHLEIACKAEKMFDKIILARGVNPEKRVDYSKLDRWPSSSYRFQREHFINSLPSFMERMRSENPYSDFVLIRGIRNSHDLLAEQNQLRWIEDMDPEINVCYLMSSPTMNHISSSSIRSLISSQNDDMKEVGKKYLVL